MPDIDLRDVRFAYPEGAGVYAEPGLSLQLRGGSIALVGENGAGKTTFTKLLNGLLRPQTGAVQVAGVMVRERSVAQMARLVGYVFQNPDDQLFERTVRAEVAFGPKMMGRTGAELAALVDAALTRCQLSSHASTHPHDLGLADRKWVTIASALAADAQVVVLDEPTLGQDRHARDRLARLVTSLAEDGRLVLVVTHDMDFVAQSPRPAIPLSSSPGVRLPTSGRLTGPLTTRTGCGARDSSSPTRPGWPGRSGPGRRLSATRLSLIGGGTAQRNRPALVCRDIQLSQAGSTLGPCVGQRRSSAINCGPRSTCWRRGWTSSMSPHWARS
ncbi:MAG: ABC transporter ATP-binding protein [Chloroflexi bacterium]|nr:MAG: ABC transporter ATP-binding protein [Chloroflexota bacterium]